MSNPGVSESDDDVLGFDAGACCRRALHDLDDHHTEVGLLDPDPEEPCFTASSVVVTRFVTAIIATTLEEPRSVAFEDHRAAAAF